jgi:hypothetical protein
MHANKSILSLAAVVLLVAGAARAEEHLVSPEAASARLAEAAAARAHDQATLETVLATPAASRAAASVGAELSVVRDAIPTLSDRELRDLARRAEALRTDPAAGLDHDVQQLLVVFLIVAIVILVIKAVD